ncbi:MAG: DNA-binding response regulator [Flavobacteriaceae bacterium]
MKVILLIEDEFIISKDIKQSLEQTKKYKVDVAKNAKQALQQFTSNTYDVIVCDINLNDDTDGIDVVTSLLEHENTPVIYLTAYSTEDVINKANTTSPHSYLLKPFNATQLQVSIDMACMNATKTEEGSVQTHKNIRKLFLLTKREVEILQTLSLGKTSKEIAEDLNISSNTVEKHKKNIKDKLELNTVGELVRFALVNNVKDFKAV